MKTVAKSRYKWDITELNSAISNLKQASTDLKSRRGEMNRQRTEIGVNWKSPAGQQYQARLETDIKTIDNILKELDEQMTALGKVKNEYDTCEREVSRATQRLPH